MGAGVAGHRQRRRAGGRTRRRAAVRAGAAQSRQQARRERPRVGGGGEHARCRVAGHRHTRPHAGRAADLHRSWWPARAVHRADGDCRTGSEPGHAGDLVRREAARAVERPGGASERRRVLHRRRRVLHERGRRGEQPGAGHPRQRHHAEPRRAHALCDQRRRHPGLRRRARRQHDGAARVREAGGAAARETGWPWMRWGACM